MQNLKVEIKTLLHMKSIWVFVFLLLLISLSYLMKGYSSAKETVDYNLSILQELEGMAREVDDSVLKEGLADVYLTYHPAMSVNNSLGLLIGLGLLLVPVMAALFVGVDYGRNQVIKTKAAHSTLLEVYAAKLLAFAGFILLLSIVYLLCAGVLSGFGWQPVEEALKATSIDYSQVELLSPGRLVAVAVLVVAILLFYSLVTMLVAAVFKRSTYGIVAVLAINYVALPFKYTPHNVIYKLINSTLYIGPASIYEFTASADTGLSTSLAAWLFAAYFAAVVAVLLLQSRFQKNG